MTQHSIAVSAAALSKYNRDPRNANLSCFLSTLLAIPCWWIILCASLQDYIDFENPQALIFYGGMTLVVALPTSLINSVLIAAVLFLPLQRRPTHMRVVAWHCLIATLLSLTFLLAFRVLPILAEASISLVILFYLSPVLIPPVLFGSTIYGCCRTSTKPLVADG